MLQHEQQHMKIGGKDDGDKLVAQLTGEIILEKDWFNVINEPTPT